MLRSSKPWRFHRSKALKWLSANKLLSIVVALIFVNGVFAGVSLQENNNLPDGIESKEQQEAYKQFLSDWEKYEGNPSWGSTRLTDTYTATDWLKLPNTGNLTWGANYDIEAYYNATRDALEWNGSVFTTNLNNVRIASEFATSGNGTVSNPYIGGIQEAINDLPDDDGENIGGMVFLPHGVYEIDSTITINKSGITLMGASVGGLLLGRSSCIKLANSADCDILEFTDDAGGCIISRLELNGNSDNNALGSAINLSEARDTYIEKCWFFNIPEDNIIIQARYHYQIYDNWFEGAHRYAIHIIPNTAVVVDVLISHNKFLCLYAKNAILAERTPSNAIGNLDIVSNFFAGKQTEHTIDLRGVIAALIHDNTFVADVESSNLHDMIYLDDQNGNKCEHIKIHDNILNGNSLRRYGVNIQGTADYVDIHNNDIYDMVTGNINVVAGANQNGLIESNPGTNPFGVITNPFNDTNQLIHISNDNSTPSASTNYTVAMTPCLIITNDSSNNDVNLSIYDEDENLIEKINISDCLQCGNIRYWLEPSWNITWGAFTGTAPTVKVVFK